ncbi:MAG: prepilin-type N-terminal cleavage/methylation domain-containing protein [Polyangiaceae bacterium]|nr:prepilin-type N-terminal cleavage/methylation domain-containing protein [Polyangiaceae bacterium]
MRTFRKLRGFTLVELMIVVAIIGVLAALAIYGVTRYLRNAKTAEARAGVGAIAKGNVSYYNNEAGVTSVLAPGTAAGFTQNICLTASKTVPINATFIKGKKYQSQDSEWKEGPGVLGKGFSCLRFSMDQPQYFLYNYTSNAATGANPAGKVFTALAHGDLNGDTVTSTFSYLGKVGAAGDNRVLLAPSIQEGDPGE